MIPTLRSERLVLRAWGEADRPPFAALNADPEVMRFLGPPLTRRQSDALVDALVSRWDAGFGFFAVELERAHEFVGFVGLNTPRFDAPFTPCVEIGWRLARPAWGVGLATEGARAVLDWARGALAPPNGELVSFTSVLNTRSRRVMEKIGMTRDPRDDFDHPLVSEDRLRPHVLYRIRVSEGATA